MSGIIAWLSGKKTNIMVVFALVLGVLVQFGYLTPEQNTEANQRLSQAIERLIGLLMEVSALIAAFLRAGVAKAEAKGEAALAEMRKQ